MNFNKNKTETNPDFDTTISNIIDDILLKHHMVLKTDEDWKKFKKIFQASYEKAFNKNKKMDKNLKPYKDIQSLVDETIDYARFTIENYNIDINDNEESAEYLKKRVCDIIKTKPFDFSKEQTDELSASQQKMQNYILDQINNSYIGNTTKTDMLRQKYFQNLMSAIVLELVRYNTDTIYDGSYRRKSAHSIIKKITGRAVKENYKPISDSYAAKIIIKHTRRGLETGKGKTIDELRKIYPKLSDAEIEKELSENKKLMAQREENLKLRNELVEIKDKYFSGFPIFREDCFFADSSSPLPKDIDGNVMDYKQYFSYMKKLIKGILTTLPENSSQLHSFYEKKLDVIEEKLQLAPAAVYRQGNGILEDEVYIQGPQFDDTPNGICDFIYLFNDFDRRINDKINQKILGQQLKEITSNPNSILSKFNISSIRIDPPKETLVGYMSQFVRITGPCGPIEIQLVTENQSYLDETGYNESHFVYKAKHTFLPKLPDLSDPESIKQYQNKINMILPDYYKFLIGQTPNGPSVSFMPFSEYDSLKKLFKTPENHHARKNIDAYLSFYKEHQNELENPNNKKSFSNMMRDVVEYLNSKDFSEICNTKSKTDNMNNSSIPSQPDDIETDELSK